MQFEDHFSPYGRIVRDDSGRFLSAFIRDGEGIVIYAGGSFENPDMTIDAPGFRDEESECWLNNEKFGCAALETNGRGFRESVFPIAYGTLARYMIMLPGSTYEGGVRGPANICADLVEIDGGEKYELVVHRGHDWEDIYDFWQPDDDTYRLAERR